MIKKILLISILLLGICLPAHALELVRQKNVATIITFPIVDADGDIVTSATSPDSEIDAWDDGAAPDGFSDCTNEATEIGSTGIYYLSLAQAEMNAAYVYIQVKTATSGAKTQHILIRTTVGNPDNAATTDDGGTINVTTGKIDEVSTLTGHTAQTGDAYAIVNNGTYGNNALNTAIAAVPTASEIQTEMEENGASILDSISDLLPASTIAAATDVPTAATNADAVWDEAATGHTDAGKAGAQQWTDIDAILEDTGTTLQGHLTDIKGATFAGATDSLEAIRDRGDAEWVTATGFSTHSAADVVTAMENNGSKLDHLWEMTEDDAGVRRLTQNALEQAPSGTGATAQEVWEYATRSLSAAADANLTSVLGTALTETYTLADAISHFFDVETPGKTMNDVGVAGSGLTAEDVWGYATRALTDKAGFALSSTQAFNLTGDITGNLSGSVGSVTGGVTVTTNNDKTGYTASTVSDKTGYALTQAFPTNFSSLAITVGGAVTAGTVSDKTGYTASTVTDKTGYSLTQAFPSNFSALSISATTGLVDITQTAADKVWGTAARTLTAGTNIALAKGTGITGFNDIAATDVWAAASRTLSDYSGVWSVASRTLSDYSGVWSVAARTITGLTAAAIADLFDTNSGTNYGAAVAGSAVKEIADNAGGSSLSEEGIADAVWNELQSGHVSPGSFGYFLDSTVSTAGGGSLTAADIWAYGTRTLTAGTYTGLTSADIDLFFDEALSGHTTAGTLGKTISNINDATDGDKESTVYTGIENLIRRHGT